MLLADELVADDFDIVVEDLVAVRVVEVEVVLTTYRIGFSVTSSRIPCTSRCAAAGDTVVSTTMAWSSLTITSELLIVVIAPVPVAKNTPSAISSNSHAGFPSVGSVSGLCATIARPTIAQRATALIAPPCTAAMLVPS